MERVGDEVDVLARLDDGSVVAVRQRNVIATAFHPELAGETRFHRLLTTMAGAYLEPAEGAGGGLTPRAGGSRRCRDEPVLRPRGGPLMPTAARSGRVRAARLTDLAAVGELSRLAHPSIEIAPQRRAPRRSEQPTPRMRSLGLPVTASHVSVFSLFRMPLGAFRPNDQMYVYDEGGRLAGLARVERDATRDEWTVVELDAFDQGAAGDVRYRLVQHLMRDGSRRGATRFHVACADRDGNVELFMQAGFTRYGEETILFRDPRRRFPSLRAIDARAHGIRPASHLDSVELARLYKLVTPTPVARLEGYRLPDWEHLPGRSTVPRTSLTPLRVSPTWRPTSRSRRTGSRWRPCCSWGWPRSSSPTTCRSMALPQHDTGRPNRYGLAIIGKRSGANKRSANPAHQHGVMACVRTYEAPVDRRLEDHGMEAIATVSLLVKEALVRVAEPSLGAGRLMSSPPSEETMPLPRSCPKPATTL